MWQCIYGCNFIQNYGKRIVFQIEKTKKKMSFLDIFTISPLQRPREISQNVSEHNRDIFPIYNNIKV